MQPSDAKPIPNVLPIETDRENAIDAIEEKT